MPGKPKKRKQIFNFRGSLCMPYGIFMALFVILPLFIIVYYSFTNSKGEFSVESWIDIFTNPINWKVIGRTFLVSTCATIVCLLIAYPVAYILANSKYNKNKILVYIFLLPMWINFVIRTIGLKFLVSALFKNVFNYDIILNQPYISIVIGMVYDYLPFAILPLYNQMLKLDKHQIEAASDLGANPTQVFFKSIIPQTIPGIISAITMTFMPTMSSYVIASEMSNRKGSIIGNMIDKYFGATEINKGSTLSLVLLMIVGISILIEKLLSRGENEQKGAII